MKYVRVHYKTKPCTLAYFISIVSSQLRFLNYKVQVYSIYRDLSPHRPFQELTQIYTKQSTTSAKETFTFLKYFLPIWF